MNRSRLLNAVALGAVDATQRGLYALWHGLEPLRRVLASEAKQQASQERLKQTTVKSIERL